MTKKSPSNCLGIIFIIKQYIPTYIQEMDDEELTKQAVAQLIAEGERFKKRHELRYRLDEPSRLKPNLRYFKNTLKNCLSSNNREEKMRKSKAAEELEYLENRAKKRRTEETIVTTEKKLKRDSTQRREEHIHSEAEVKSKRGDKFR